MTNNGQEVLKIIQKNNNKKKISYIDPKKM